jgi:hypothetical protein
MPHGMHPGFCLCFSREVLLMNGKAFASISQCENNHFIHQMGKISLKKAAKKAQKYGTIGFIRGVQG